MTFQRERYLGEAFEYPDAPVHKAKRKKILSFHSNGAEGSWRKAI
jgi:hypothetical protein